VQSSAAASGNIFRTSVLSEITSIYLFSITAALPGVFPARTQVAGTGKFPPEYFTLIGIISKNCV
jgi:hypothetical protein